MPSVLSVDLDLDLDGDLDRDGNIGRDLDSDLDDDLDLEGETLDLDLEGETLDLDTDLEGETLDLDIDLEGDIDLDGDFERDTDLDRDGDRDDFRLVVEADRELAAELALEATEADLEGLDLFDTTEADLECLLGSTLGDTDLDLDSKLASECSLSGDENLDLVLLDLDRDSSSRVSVLSMLSSSS